MGPSALGHAPSRESEHLDFVFYKRTAVLLKKEKQNKQQQQSSAYTSLYYDPTTDRKSTEPSPLRSSQTVSVCERLSAFKHPAQDHLDAASRADSFDPAVGPLPLDVLRLIFGASLAGADLLVMPGG